MSALHPIQDSRNVILRPHAGQFVIDELPLMFRCPWQRHLYCWSTSFSYVLLRLKVYLANTTAAPQRWREAVAKNPPLLHPVVRTHPVSGKQALFVNEGFTTRIVDVSEKESEALLGFLFAHITKPEFQVRWRWQPNDIAIWDNRVTQHYANADYLPQRRIMHRATILGDKPFYRAG